jgi:excisionase family DNA binding protein
MDDLLTIADATKVLGRKPDTVRKYLKFEALPFNRTGPCGQILIRRSDLDEWRSRPETLAMFASGDRIHAYRRAVISA